MALDVILAAGAKPTFAAGGTCGNVLTALSYLDWRAIPVARLGKDPASEIVRRDLEAWSVHLDFTVADPTAQTPIIVQHIVRRGKGVEPNHRFSWNCPDCGSWLPSFRPVLASTAQDIATTIGAAAVFFFDRVSRSAILLATAAARQGALVVFEPSSSGDPKLFQEALDAAHILKYSRERFPRLSGRDCTPGILLEVETLGSRGLRYRGALLKNARRWRDSEATHTPTTVDAAGAGDWCTAALISRVGCSGLAGFETTTKQELEDALQFAQATAAWACQYEGSRGGMYETSRVDFQNAVIDILKGTTNSARPVRRISSGSRSMAEICPVCARGQGSRDRADDRTTRHRGVSTLGVRRSSAGA